MNSRPAFEAAWVAAARGTADRLEAELHRTHASKNPDYVIAAEAIARARVLADRPHLAITTGWFRRTRRGWRRIGAWWSGEDVDQAWAALHIAGQALLDIESVEVVKAQIGDMAANVVTMLGVEDLRVKDYLATLNLLAPTGRDINAADRAQLRAIRQVCDSAADTAHADARSYRNTMIAVGVLLAAALGVVAAIAIADSGLRSVFAATNTTPGRWYVLELEIVASLSGLTGAVLSLRNYTGFQSAYGLPLVQAFVKGGAGAATGLLGVLLVQSGLISSLKAQPGTGVFAIAVIFGYAQYLFTRLLDQKAQDVLSSASSRNDPGTTPKVGPGTDQPTLLTTDRTPPAPHRAPAPRKAATRRPRRTS